MKIEAFSSGLACGGEKEICGNLVSVIREAACVTAIFADGEGDGTGASISAAYIERMASSMLGRGMMPRAVVEAVSEVYNADAAETPAPGITVLRATEKGDVSFAVFNMPYPVVIARGKALLPAPEDPGRCRRQVVSAGFPTRSDCMIVVFNEGLLLAGRGGVNWNYGDIGIYLRSVCRARTTGAEKAAGLLLTAAGSLDLGKPGHDMSVLTFSLKKGG